MTDEQQQSGSVQLVKPVDYTQIIGRLRQRAARARISRTTIGLVLVASIGAAVSFLVFKATDSSSTLSMKSRPIADFFKASPSKVSTALSSRASKLVTNLNTDDAGTADKPATKRSTAEVSTTKQQLKETLDDLDRAVQIEAKQKGESTSEWQGVLSTAVLSLGAITLLIMLIQIAVSFMRYYARLAEAYEAQADAFLAAGGDPHLAYGFLKHLHVEIDLGAAPTTLYEKALDTIKEVASKKG